MENENVLKGVKLNRKKTILIAWVFVVIFVAAYFSYLLIGYSKYHKLQVSCSNLMKVTELLAGTDISEDEEEFLRTCRNKLSPGTIIYSGGSISKELADTMNQSYASLRASAKELFRTVGYPQKWQPSYVFLYRNFVEYSIGQFQFTDHRWDDETIVNIVFFSVMTLCFVCVLITQIVNSSHSKQQLSIENNKVFYQSGKKKDEIEASRITSVVKKPYHGVKITSPGKNITVSMLKNQVEIVDCITDLINNKKDKDAATVAAVGEKISSAQQLKEWKELLDAGVISAEEFESKKKNLLDSMQ